LRRAGTLSPRSPLAIASALPWLFGRGVSLGIVSQMNAVTIGGKVAIHDRLGSLTFRELDGEANRTARAMANLGVSGGDKMAMVLRNGREMIQFALAAQKSGVIACPLNTWAKTKELKAVMGSVAPELIVYDTAHAEQVAATTPEGTPLIHVGTDNDALPGSVPLEAFLEGCSSSPLSPITRNRGSARIIIQTSGTTGTPKGAARDASASGMGAIANLLGSVPYHRSDVILCPAPMFHSFGLATVTFAMALGATLVLPARFDPEESLRLIEEHQATAASFVPVMIRRIVSLDDEIKKRYDLGSLRIVLASGSALSLDLKREATSLLGEVLYDLYGSTEAGWVAIATPEDMRQKPRSVGRPVDGIEVAIFGESGERKSFDEVGEIYVKSNVMFEGYTSGENKAEREGYISIGDLGRVDTDGHLYIESRTDDMVVIGGENVYPIEVEETIENIEGVTEVTVLGVDDDEFGQVLAAFVVGSVDESTIAATCRRELASYKVPRHIRVVDELPRTSTGKVLKRELLGRL
jgi:fatty-acyl-CoA synthase